MLKRRADQGQHFVHAVQHFVIADTEHAIALLLQKGGSLFVVFQFGWSGMCCAIDLDNEFHAAAGEVGKVRSNWVLVDEF